MQLKKERGFTVRDKSSTQLHTKELLAWSQLQELTTGLSLEELLSRNESSSWPLAYPRLVASSSGSGLLGFNVWALGDN